jgi:hypothetical protein
VTGTALGPVFMDLTPVLWPIFGTWFVTELSFILCTIQDKKIMIVCLQRRKIKHQIEKLEGRGWQYIPTSWDEDKGTERRREIVRNVEITIVFIFHFFRLLLSFLFLVLWSFDTASVDWVGRFEIGKCDVGILYKKRDRGWEV